MNADRYHPPRRPRSTGIASAPPPRAGRPRSRLFSVRAAGLNRADLGLREGKYGGAPVAGVVPGLEVAGEVVEVGAVGPARWR
ncbi:MAG: hypothetical protein WKG07_00955 [Hymenobacter sp.]